MKYPLGTVGQVIESTQVVGYGREASEALVATIGAAQQQDPLAPVTVIVPSNFVGLSVRRLLGSQILRAGERVGLANVSFVTPFQLAEQVAADLLLDTRPITNPVLGAAVRRALAEDPGPYAPVAHHEATESALASLFAELSNVDEVGLEAIEEEGSTAAVLAVQFHRAIASHLGGFHTERDLAIAASECADLAARLVPFGHVVWYLPAPTTAALGGFVGRVLSDAVSSSVIVGVTGAERADAPVWAACSGADVAVAANQQQTIDQVATGDHIVSVTDAAEEAREVCRRVLALIADGTPADRIGIFYPTPDPYVRVIEQQFDAAGLPANGPDPRRLADSVAGRTILAALELPGERWRRDRVMALVSGGPIFSGDDRVRPGAWDDLTREAGVVADLADWGAKLERYRAAKQERLDGVDPAEESWYRQRLVDTVADVGKLQAFIDGVAAGVAAVGRGESWSDRSAAATELLQNLLGKEHRHSTWPESEHDAFGRVEASLVRLAALDDIEPAPTTAVFIRALRSELDVARGRRGRFGQGVMFGPVGSSVGHDLDAVFIVGAVEGMLPVPRRDDAILPEQVRTHSLHQLESKSARLDHQHRAFLAALAAAPSGQRTLLLPRGSLRSNRRTLPSRWLLDTASVLAGGPVHATDFAELDGSVVEVVGSFASGITDGSDAPSVEERDLVVLRRAGVPAEHHPLASLVGRGLEMQLERVSGRFTVFDGNLAGLGTEVGDRLVSPSRLETWATCGFRYFLKYVLEVSDRNDPERTDEISALDRGSLIHLVLERFIEQAIERGAPEPDTAWTDADRERLHAIADEVAAVYVDTGRTGRAVNWRVKRDDLHGLLDAFIEVDDRFRSANRATPTRVELDFGVREGDPVEIPLPDGRVISMRGLADRVDTTADGRVIVSDYKSGKQTKFLKLDDDPFVAGTGLQLAMYSEGALRHAGGSRAEAAYWLVEAEDQERLGYAWTDALRERFLEVLAVIVDGIDAGMFAAAPGDWNTFRQTNEACTYCEFDSVCVRNRGEQAQAKSSASEVQIRERLQVDTEAGVS
jgi:ATP-dependent helicase/nuclease subunit B